MADRDHQGIVQLCWLYPWDILVAEMLSLFVSTLLCLLYHDAGSGGL